MDEDEEAEEDVVAAPEPAGRSTGGIRLSHLALAASLYVLVAHRDLAIAAALAFFGLLAYSANFLTPSEGENGARTRLTQNHPHG